MSDATLERRVLELFTEVAPDVDPNTLQRNLPFRAQFDFDSMDRLNFALSLHKEFGIEIPERDYRHLASLDEVLAYVRSKTPSNPT